MAHFIDISRQLPAGHPNWPGDPPLSLTPAAQMARGDSVNTTTLQTSTHTGTHVDAPRHYADTAPKLEEVPLERYLGPALVVAVPPGQQVEVSALVGLPAQLPPRLLLHTGQPEHWATFPQCFMPLSPEFVREVARRGVALIGTDCPSVDGLHSKTLDAHHACLHSGVLILEGLNLSKVTPGEYTLICLPLPLAGVDGAPARAILLPAGTPV